MGLHRKPPTWALPVGQLGVIGMARFSMLTGAITKLQRVGCIKSITFVGTSQFGVNLWPPQRLYTASMAASSDGSNVSFATINSTPTLGPNGFQGQVIGLQPLTGRNSGMVDVTIFGFQTARVSGTIEPVLALPHGRLGVIGTASFNIVSNSAVSNVALTGCCSSVVSLNGSGPSGNAAVVSLNPVPKFWTYMGMASDLASARKCFLGHADAFNANGFLASLTPQPINVTGSLGNAPAKVCMTIFSQIA